MSCIISFVYFAIIVFAISMVVGKNKNQDTLRKVSGNRNTSTSYNNTYTTQNTFSSKQNTKSANKNLTNNKKDSSKNDFFTKDSKNDSFFNSDNGNIFSEPSDTKRYIVAGILIIIIIALIIYSIIY